MIIKLNQLSDVQAQLLMPVYRESNRQNVPHFFPEVTDIEKGLALVEEAYRQWLREDFFEKDNTACYVWEEEGVWLSSLRLHEVGDREYFVEALETHPDYRRQGHAEKLLKGMIKALSKTGAVRIHSYTSLKNVASQKIHQKCGFKEVEGKVFDYTTQEFVDHAVGFLLEEETEWK